MSNVTLTPCKLRETRIVPQNEAAVRLTWKEMIRKFGSANVQEKAALRTLQPNYFVGLIRKKNGTVGQFLLCSADRSGEVEWLLKQVPDFPTRLIEVYRVEEVTFEGTVAEPGSAEISGG